MYSGLSQNKEDGFTLVELLVTILIIGVLATIAVPAFLNQRKAAHTAALRTDMHNVATAVEGYLVQHPNDMDIQPEEVATYMGGDKTRLSVGTNVLIFGGYDNWCLVGANRDSDLDSFNSEETGLLYDSFDGGFKKQGSDLWAAECITGAETGRPDPDSQDGVSDDRKNINWFLRDADEKIVAP